MPSKLSASGLSTFRVKKGPMPIPLAERFWQKVARTSSGCWNWSGKRLPRGYGQTSWSSCEQPRDKRCVYAHRAAWVLTFGAIPDGLCVCHHCDNPSCCNPDHLFLGTHKDNIADMDRKGRRVTVPNPKGNVTYSKLGTTEVYEIRKLYAMIPKVGAYKKRGEVRKIFEQFAISEAQLHNIVTNKCWSANA